MYVNGIGVHQIMDISRVGQWENVTGRVGTRLPTFRHVDGDRTVRVNVSPTSPTFRAVLLRGAGTYDRDLFTAQTQGQMAETLRDYFSQSEFDFS